MPKAILELPEMPGSCWQCELYSTAHNCCNVIVIVGHYAICPSKGRRSDCPLNLVDADALEKQIPKKVIETPDKHKYGYCQVCGRIYLDKCHIGNYCDQCGQRLEVEP